jgi:hypothetical protein
MSFVETSLNRFFGGSFDIVSLPCILDIVIDVE